MDSSSQRPWRFISGAVCPRCATPDRLTISPDGETRRCIDCGFEDGRPTEGVAAEPSTRVTRASARRLDAQAEPVTLLDGKKSSSDAGDT